MSAEHGVRFLEEGHVVSDADGVVGTRRIVVAAVAVNVIAIVTDAGRRRRLEHALGASARIAKNFP